MLQPQCHIEKCPCRDNVSLSLAYSSAVFQPRCWLDLALSPVNTPSVTCGVLGIQTGLPFWTSIFPVTLENSSDGGVFVLTGSKIFEPDSSPSSPHLVVQHPLA